MVGMKGLAGIIRTYHSVLEDGVVVLCVDVVDGVVVVCVVPDHACPRRER